MGLGIISRFQSCSSKTLQNFRTFSNRRNLCKNVALRIAAQQIALYGIYYFRQIKFVTKTIWLSKFDFGQIQHHILQTSKTEAEHRQISRFVTQFWDTKEERGNISNFRPNVVTIHVCKPPIISKMQIPLYVDCLKLIRNPLTDTETLEEASKLCSRLFLWKLENDSVLEITQALHEI